MLTAAILARDEAATIERCLGALSWADERLVVVDAATSDETAALATALGAHVVTRPLVSFAEQRNIALELAETDWVLFVDADEVVTTELSTEVLEVIGRDRPDQAEPAGYWVPRRNIICGRWIRHAGWYPDEQLRLLRRGRARYDMERPVHEVVLLDGQAGHLRQPLVHYNYDDLAQFRRKQAYYADLEALALHRRGLRPRPRNFVLQPLREFWRRYVTLRGYRDGLLGFQLSLLLGWSTFLTYRQLQRLWRGP